MPIARVQMPDGRVAKLDVPDGTTPQQVEAFVFQQVHGKGGQDFSSPDAPSALERLGRGFEDVRTGVKQLGTALGEKVASISLGEQQIDPSKSRGAEATKQGTDEQALYEKGRGPDAGMDWVRLAGNVIGTAPVAAVGGGAASLGARVGIGTGQGAASSAAIFTPEHESKLKQTLIGAGFGAAMPVVLQGVKMAYGGVRDKIASYSMDPAKNPALAKALSQDVQVALEQKGVDFGQLTQEVRDRLVQDAGEALKVGGKLDADALARKATIEATGAKPTRAAVTRSPQDWQFEQNTRGLRDGIGDPLVKRAQDNATALTDYLGKLRSGTGGKTSTALETGESAIGALKAGDAEKEKAVAKLYDAFRASGAQEIAVPAAKIADTLGKVADEIGHENIPPAVMNRLKEFGLMGSKQTKLLTVNEADKLNRLINNNNPGNGPASLALGRIKGAVNQALLDVEPAGQQGVEALKTARAAAAQRFAEQDAGKGITAALDDVAPDKFVQKFIVGADVRDVAAMKAELLKSPAGTQALKDTKGHILDSLLMKATGATSADDVAGKAFSGSRFSKALDSIEPEKLHMLFSPDEVGQLRTLQKASKYLTEEVPFSDVNHSKTTAALANLMLKIGNTPVLGHLVSPIVGTLKLGADWLKDSKARQAVAEALAGGVPVDKTPSASILGKMLETRAPSALEKVAPGAAGAYADQPSNRKK